MNRALIQIERTREAGRFLDGLAARGSEKGVGLAAAARAFLAGSDIGGDSPLGGPSDPFTQSLWVYRCIDTLATSGSGTPLRLSRGEAAGTRAMGAWKSIRCGPHAGRKCVRSEKAAGAVEGEIVEAGPLYDFLRQPNPESSWSDFIYQTIGALKLCGRVHWIFDEMRGRRPVTAYVVSGDLSEPILTRGRTGRRLLGWRIQGGDGGRYDVGLEECVTFQKVHPGRPWEAVSPISPANLAVVSDYNASRYNASMFGNAAEPGGVLETEAAYSAEQDAQIRTAWHERHRGAGRAKAVAVLWGGLKWQSVASTMADMQFSEGKRLTRTETCAAFGVPEVVAGFYTDANYGFAETGQEQFWWASMMPLLAALAEGINFHVAGRFDGGLDAWFDLEDNPVVQRMRLKRLDAADKLWTKGVPLADCNDMLDLGIPERNWHQVGFLPSGLLPATDVASGGGFSPVPEGPPAGEPTDDLGQANGGARNPERGARNENLTPQEKDARGRIWRAWARSWAPLAQQLRQVLRSHYFEQERRVRAAVAAAMPKAAEKTSQVDQLLIEVFRDPKAVAAFRARIHSAFVDGRELGLRQALAESGLSGDALAEALRRLLADPARQAALWGEAIIISTRIDAVTRDRVRAALEEGLAAGEDYRKLASRIEAYFGGRRGQAMMVARNTIGQVLSKSRHEGVLSTGMTHKIWLHTRAPEAAPRPGHVAAEAEYAAEPCPIAEPFIVQGEAGAVRLMYPRDPSGPAEEIVNCQCLAIYKRFAQDERADVAAMLKDRETGGFAAYQDAVNARAAAPAHEHGEHDEA